LTNAIGYKQYRYIFLKILNIIYNKTRYKTARNETIYQQHVAIIILFHQLWCVTNVKCCHESYSLRRFPIYRYTTLQHFYPFSNREAIKSGHASSFSLWEPVCSWHLPITAYISIFMTIVYIGLWNEIQYENKMNETRFIRHGNSQEVKTSIYNAP